MSLEANRRAAKRADDAVEAGRRGLFANLEAGIWMIVVLLVVAFAVWTYDAILSLP